MVRLRLIFTIILISHLTIVQALESVTLQAGTLHAKNWKLEGISIALTELAKNPQKLTLLISKLELPQPFGDISLVNIQCSSFTWQNEELLCQQGKGELRSKRWHSPEVNFSFHFRENHNSLQLNGLQLAGGTFTIEVEEIGQQWILQVNAKNVDSQLIHKVVQTGSFNLKKGHVNFRLHASGSHEQVQNLKLDADLDQLTLQTPSGQFATEKLALNTHLQAQHEDNRWQWQIQTQLKNGALYVEPLYLEAGKPELNLLAQGDWDSANHRLEISSAQYQHSLAADISGNATIHFDKGVLLEKADVSIQSKDLRLLTDVYLKPFFTQTPLEGISLAGALKARLTIVQQSLSTLSASLNKLAIADEGGRINIQGGTGEINWADDTQFAKPSQLSWQQLIIGSLPIGSSHLSFLTKAKSIRILKAASLPFLGGALDIQQFNWQVKDQDEPDVSFKGSLRNASLTQLSTALKWTPLSGSLSGDIPKVTYHNKTLSLDGKLTINVFDGIVSITNLSSSGLFSAFPKLQGDIEIEHLDLEQLTGKFSFGSISGRLSGFVRQLSMENWKPVTFYAWLGTPDDDDSSHRISQRAVNNIASIGGGGASDILSRSFLGMFETFGYDKLGLGCYLHQGVCQLMGVKATASGYAMITGGGLPRIDVIGYNPRVDWNVLIDRLGRITTSDKVIVK